MSVPAMHPEDVRAEIRKRFGTLNKFADAKGIKRTLIFDLLRGKSSTASTIVADAIGVNPDEFRIMKNSTHLEIDSKAKGRAHSLNAGAK